MDSLINNNTKWWNIEEIIALFNLNIETGIMKIIFCLEEQKDKLTWTQEKNGRFSVRSTYRFFKAKQRNNVPGVL